MYLLALSETINAMQNDPHSNAAAAEMEARSVSMRPEKFYPIK